MLKLDLKKEPYWLDLPAGVRIKVRPLSTAVMSAAQASAVKQISSIRQERKSLVDVGADVSGVPDIEDEQTRSGLSEALLIKALARGAIIAWEGVLWFRRICGLRQPELLKTQILGVKQP